jgi:hypothetical protein
VDAAHMAVEEWSKSAIAPDTLDEDRSAFIGRVDMLRNWLADRA